MAVLGEIMQEIAQPQRQVEQLIKEAATEEPNSAVREVILYSTEGGKRVRSILTLLSARLFAQDLEPAVPVAAAVELIHAATLLHDDVIDSAEHRRHKPTVNCKWGNKVAILAGDSLLARAITLLAQRSTPQILQIIARALQRMCEGEIMQSETLVCGPLAEAKYLDQIERKTAEFFRACCEAGALAVGANANQVEALSQFGRHVGMAYQIIDDLLDIVGNEETLGKPVGADLRTGVLTLPWLYFLQKTSADQSVRVNISSLAAYEQSKLAAMLQKYGALEYTVQTARRYADSAKAVLLHFPSNNITRLLTATVDALVPSCL